MTCRKSTRALAQGVMVRLGLGGRFGNPLILVQLVLNLPDADVQDLGGGAVEPPVDSSVFVIA